MGGGGTSAFEPGWYHAAGDPPGTARYWDGQAWQGEPTTTPGSGQVFFAEPASEPVRESASSAIVREVAQPQQRSTTVSANSREGKRLLRQATFSEDLRTQATGYSMLGVVPMAILAWVMVRWRSGTDQPEVLSRLDLGRDYDPGDVLLVAVVAGFALLALQFIAALAHRPWLVAIGATGLAFMWVVFGYAVWTDTELYGDATLRSQGRVRMLAAIPALVHSFMAQWAFRGGATARARRRQILRGR